MSFPDLQRTFIKIKIALDDFQNADSKQARIASKAMRAWTFYQKPPSF
jgi:hypothetical protein